MTSDVAGAVEAAQALLAEQEAQPDTAAVAHTSERPNWRELLDKTLDDIQSATNMLDRFDAIQNAGEYPRLMLLAFPVSTRCDLHNMQEFVQIPWTVQQLKAEIMPAVRTSLQNRIAKMLLDLSQLSSFVADKYGPGTGK